MKFMMSQEKPPRKWTKEENPNDMLHKKCAYLVPNLESGSDVETDVLGMHFVGKKWQSSEGH